MNSRMILFSDIETVAEYEKFSDMPEHGQAAFRRKYDAKVNSGEFFDIEEAYRKQAAFHAEFAKIVCISVGRVFPMDGVDNGREVLKGYCLVGDEISILERFAKLCGMVDFVCAHNGKAFDFPFISRRMIIHQVPLPPILDVRNRKPWDIAWIDTMHMWTFGDFKYYTSLITLAYALGLENPKDEVSGADVEALYRAGEIDKIGKYCNSDMVILANCYRIMRYEHKFNPEEVIISEHKNS